MNIRRNSASMSILILSVIVSSLTLSGCETLRKKFTRKKKKDAKNEFQPILETVDYADLTNSPAVKYDYHYMLWVNWEKSMKEALNDDALDKKQKYYLEQMITNFDRMQELAGGQFEDIFVKEKKNLMALRKDLDKPLVMRNVRLMEIKLDRHTNNVRTSLNPSLVFVTAIDE